MKNLFNTIATANLSGKTLTTISSIRTPDTGHRTPDTGHRTPDTGHRTPDTGHRTLICDRTVMNVLTEYPITFNRIAFAMLFILSNLLFFQPTQAQVLSPFSGYTCDVNTECPWINDSTEFRSPPGGTIECYAVVYYKHRSCKGYLELQPMAVRFDNNCPLDSDAISANLFYGDTLYTQRMEQMLRNAERYLVAKAFNDFYNSLDPIDTTNYTAYIQGDALFADSTFKIGFYRPACRGICISYGRLNASSPINSQYAKWYNCGQECCEIISYLARDTINTLTTIPPTNISDYYIESTYSNYVRMSFVQQTFTSSCSSSTPNVPCNPGSLNTNVTRFHFCRNYCTDSAGVFYGPYNTDPFGLPNLDNSKNGLINMNEMPFISDKILQSLPKDLMLESTTNEMVVSISEDVLAVKIVSLSGVEIQKHTNIHGKAFQSISVQYLQNGLYLLVFETKTGTISKPLIIAK